MNTTVVSPTSAPTSAPTFRNALAFEWTKFVTARATSWTLLVMTLMMPVMSMIVAATESIQPDDTILGGSLTGAVVAPLVAGAVGALTISTEHTTGMIRTTFTAVPRRSRVLAAKALVVTALLAAATLVSALVAFGLGLLLLDGDTYRTGDPFPALLGVAAAVTIAGLLGLAVGAFVRRSAGAIAGVAAVLFVPTFVAPFLGDYQRWLGGASLTAIVQKLAQSSDVADDVAGSAGGWPSLALATIGVGLLLVGSSRWIQRRDA